MKGMPRHSPVMDTHRWRSACLSRSCHNMKDTSTKWSHTSRHVTTHSISFPKSSLPDESCLPGIYGVGSLGGECWGRRGKGHLKTVLLHEGNEKFIEEREKAQQIQVVIPHRTACLHQPPLLRPFFCLCLFATAHLGCVGCFQQDRQRQKRMAHR